jgi:hypothetical protein
LTLEVALSRVDSKTSASAVETRWLSNRPLTLLHEADIDRRVGRTKSCVRASIAGGMTWTKLDPASSRWIYQRVVAVIFRNTYSDDDIMEWSQGALSCDAVTSLIASLGAPRLTAIPINNYCLVLIQLPNTNSFQDYVPKFRR